MIDASYKFVGETVLDETYRNTGSPWFLIQIGIQLDRVPTTADNVITIELLGSSQDTIPTNTIIYQPDPVTDAARNYLYLPGSGVCIPQYWGLRVHYANLDSVPYKVHFLLQDTR